MQNKKCGPDSRGRISCLISIFVFLSSFAFSGRMVQPFCLQTSTLPRIWVEPQNVLMADLGWKFQIIIASLLSLVAWKRKKTSCKQKGKTVPKKYTALVPMVQHSYTRSIPLLYYPESYCPVTSTLAFLQSWLFPQVWLLSQVCNLLWQ